MDRYLVKFSKRVLGGDFHEVDACQFTIELTASDDAVARRKAIQAFCKAHKLSQWQDHADRLQVLKAEFPS